MLRASTVEILLTRTDLEEILAGHAAGVAEVEKVQLLEGAALVRLKVTHDRLPMAVPVELKLAVRKVDAMQVELDVAWSNLPFLPGFLKELALQKAFEALPGDYRGGIFVVDLADVLEEVPVQFSLESVTITPEGIRAKVANVMAFPLQPGVLIEVEAAAGALVPVPSTTEAQLPEHQGYYVKLRERVNKFAAEKAPRWVKPLLPWVLAVPDFFVLMVRLARDERVPAVTKAMAVAVIAYIITPIDLIPDAIPILGEVDDVGVVLFALEQIARRVPVGVVQELWPGEGQVFDLVREGTQLFSKVLPARMVESIQKLISKG